jgi:hypothetical protein
MKLPPIIIALGLFGSTWALGQDSFSLATRAAEIIGIGRTGKCSSCHATNSVQTLQRWALAQDRVEDCLGAQAETDAKQKLACIAQREVDASYTLRPSQLGFYSAGLHLSAFQTVLQTAVSKAEAEDINARLRSTTLMPIRSSSLLTEEEFVTVQNWMNRGLPHLSELLQPYDGPTTCESHLDPSLTSHLEAMELYGWQRRNQDRGLFMFACSSSSGTCFTQQRNGQALFPEVSSLPEMAEWKRQGSSQMHLLHELDQETEYWIRSSADGRFIAYGGSPSGIVDLQGILSPASQARRIEVDAFYDPSFFPDDTGFVFQGRRTGICSMSLLRNPRTTRITFSEDLCTLSNQAQIPLYQSVGASLDGTDYLAATGEFVSDIGQGPLSQAKARLNSDPSHQLFLFPLQYDGQKWTRRPPQIFSTPWELDWGLAPSNRLLSSRLVGRVQGQLQHIAYKLSMLNRTIDQGQAGPYTKTSLGQLCSDGLKGNFSYDDRFFVSYSYIKPNQWQQLGYSSPDDPAFQERLEAGAANVILYDLLTKRWETVTAMGPEQFALFPHFRSDGWLYFMVYDARTKRRFLLASDLAVRIKAEHPTLRTSW